MPCPQKRVKMPLKKTSIMNKVFKDSFDLVLEMGEELNHHFWEVKEDLLKGKETTHAYIDEAIEKKMMMALKKIKPNSSFLAEESFKRSNEEMNQGWKEEGPFWIIDPLDGSNNFYRGIDLFAISLAYAERGEVLFSFVHRPITQESYLAIKGEGAFYLRGKKLNKWEKINSKEKKKGEMLLSFSIHLPLEELEVKWSSLIKVFRQVKSVRRFGCTSLEICLSSFSSMDLHYQVGSFPWDIAAGLLFCREAGGEVYTLKGEFADYFDQEFFISRRALSKELRSALAALS